MTKLLNAAGRGGSGPAETTAKLTDLSDSDIVIDMCIVCRHVIISKRAVKSTAVSNKTYLFQLTNIYLFWGSVTLST